MKFRDLIYLNKSDRNSLMILVSVVAVVLAVLVFSDDKPAKTAVRKEKSEYIYPKSRGYARSETRRNTDDMPIGCDDERHTTLQCCD